MLDHKSEICKILRMQDKSLFYSFCNILFELKIAGDENFCLLLPGFGTGINLLYCALLCTSCLLIVMQIYTQVSDVQLLRDTNEYMLEQGGQSMALPGLCLIP